MYDNTTNQYVEREIGNTTDSTRDSNIFQSIGYRSRGLLSVEDTDNSTNLKKNETDNLIHVKHIEKTYEDNLTGESKYVDILPFIKNLHRNFTCKL